MTRTRPDADRDTRDEIDFYIEERARELEADGVDPAQARRQARAAFGDRDRIEAACRTIDTPAQRRRRWLGILEALWIDVRQAARGVRAAPGFAALVIATLALCLGANAAVFSVVYQVVLRPLPFHEPDRIVSIANSYPAVGVRRAASSGVQYLERRAHVEALAETSLAITQSSSVGEATSVRNAFSMAVTPSFFAVMGVDPLLGRTFLESEAEAGSHRVVVLSHGGWHRFFDGSEDVVGRSLRVGGHPHTVVGVMPPTFRYPNWDAELWIPLVLTPFDASEPLRHSNTADEIGRLADGYDARQAEQEIAALDQTALEAMAPAEAAAIRSTEFRTLVDGLHETLIGSVRPAVMLLWAGALAVLLIGCVNVANMQFVRSTTRQRELATRLVLGAGRGRLVRQLVAESLVVAGLGGATGIALAGWALRGLSAFEVYQIPRLDQVSIGAATGGMVAVSALIVGGVTGLAPLLLLRSRDLQASLRSGGPTQSSSRAAGSLRATLVVAQVALAVVLLAGAGLLLGSFVRLTRVDPGFDPDGILVGALNLPEEGYSTRREALQFLQRFADATASVPGIEGAAVASAVPFSGSASRGSTTVPEDALAGDREPVAHYRTAVGPGYFEVLGLRPSAGRDFRPADSADAPGVAIVDEIFARTYFPGGNALGQRLTEDLEVTEESRFYRIVGVVPPILHEELARANETGAFYLPHAQAGGRFSRIAWRTSVEPRSLLPELRATLARLDPELPLFWTMTMRESVAETLIPRRVPMQLLILFGVAASLLAGLGIYGVLAFAVGQRAREIGIRVAVGGRRGQILMLVVRQALTLVAIGLTIGVGVALASSRALASLLYEIEPRNPVVLGAVALLMLFVATAAALAPGRRATRVDPVRALRSE